jgi:hypothetical protein
MDKTRFKVELRSQVNSSSWRWCVYRRKLMLNGDWEEWEQIKNGTESTYLEAAKKAQEAMKS